MSTLRQRARRWSGAFVVAIAVTSGVHDGLAAVDVASSSPPGEAPAAEGDVAATNGEPPGSRDAILALAALDRKIADLDAEEQAHKAELSGLSGKISLSHHRAVQRGRMFYKLTRAGMLPIGGGFDALVTHAMNVERVRKSLQADLGAEKHFRSRGAELAQALERVASDRTALATQRSAMDAARLAVLDEARRDQAFAQAFEDNPGSSSGYTAVYGASEFSPGAGYAEVGHSGFAAAKGRLLFPVAGRAETRPGRREGAEGPGLEIKSTLGTPVRAVFAARVAFADRYGSYGRIVILDHGDHYYTVSGNLRTIDVHVGDELGAGERIGTVGDEGQGPLLFFEVRHGSDTVAPGPWLGL